ncbi:NAD-dependent epimerase/dehydratase family protein [Deinococcus sp. YIM 77859]|uniref:NAD-dependent epimerase/dehydratase family protein n=1 Tax=Deinococcus sp. YIM 77859 TaxID=1540221 RepID=UPI000553AE6F|nr:NAD-dependent epimerase/dehydratase family protein [Deinococcus sp. YIM 77859]
MGIPVDAKIYVAGHESVMGTVLCQKLRALGYGNIITRGAADLDLRDQPAVYAFFEQELPDYVFIAPLGCEHVLDNLLRPAESLYGRLMSLFNLVHASYLYEVRKLLSIIDCQFTVEALRYETDEVTLRQYRLESREADELLKSVAAGLCDRYRRQYNCDFISVVFHPEASAVDTSKGPVILTRGTSPHHGDHLYSDDPADACLFLMENFSATGAIAVLTGPRGSSPA